MKLAATIARSLQADMQADLRSIERAVASGTREAGRALRTELRRQVGSAGLGQRLANSWWVKHYPNQKLDAASVVYTKAPQIIGGFDEGAVIRSRRGRFLAIPTKRAERHRRQADQPEHVSAASLWATPPALRARLGEVARVFIELRPQVLENLLAEAIKIANPPSVGVPGCGVGAETSRSVGGQARLEPRELLNPSASGVRRIAVERPLFRRQPGLGKRAATIDEIALALGLRSEDTRLDLERRDAGPCRYRGAKRVC
jgi:hypothetical protein